MGAPWVAIALRNRFKHKTLEERLEKKRETKGEAELGNLESNKEIGYESEVESRQGLTPHRSL